MRCRWGSSSSRSSRSSCRRARSHRRRSPKHAPIISRPKWEFPEWFCASRLRVAAPGNAAHTRGRARAGRARGFDCVTRGRVGRCALRASERVHRFVLQTDSLLALAERGRGATFKVGSPAAASAPALGSPLPHLHRDWAHPCHVCTGTGLTTAAFERWTAPNAPTSAPGLGRSMWATTPCMVSSISVPCSSAGPRCQPTPLIPPHPSRPTHPALHRRVGSPVARQYRDGLATASGTRLSAACTRDFARPRPHLHRDWAHPRPHLHRDTARPLACLRGALPLICSLRQRERDVVGVAYISVALNIVMGASTNLHSLGQCVNQALLLP